MHGGDVCIAPYEGGMMILRYDGPREAIVIAGYGAHRRGEPKEYPDDVAAMLLATSQKQRFTRLEGGPAPLALVKGGRPKKGRP